MAIACPPLPSQSRYQIRSSTHRESNIDAPNLANRQPTGKPITGAFGTVGSLGVYGVAIMEEAVESAGELEREIAALRLAGRLHPLLPAGHET
jgi:hypothetical protein